LIVVSIFGGQNNFVLRHSRLLNVALTSTRLQSLFTLFLPAFSCSPYFKPIKHKELNYNTTNHKIHFILGTNYYMFRHLGAILREFINNRGSKRISNSSRRKFHHKN